MTTYAERMTAPALEDFGETQLIGGRAYVQIDKSLGDAIDQRSTYQVFLTPEGDCNGLYVARKSASGFTVRELRRGQSTLAFSYRILAKPLDENGTRLAAAPLRKHLPFGHSATQHHLPMPLAPERRLQERLGASGYAEALRRLRSKAYV